MNKKICALIIVVIILTIIGGVFVLINSSKETEKQNNILNDDNINTNSQGEIKENNKEGNIDISNKNMGKVLIVYYSWSGNTETVANFIHNEVGGDIVKLEPEEAYTDNINELSGIAQKEKRDNARPLLKTRIDNISEYDTIFLGYPNWWSDMPMLMYTFLDEYDLSGKTIAPFVTHGESGLSGTPSKIQKEEPNSKVTEGLAIQHDNIENSESAVKEWISAIKF